jgi:hypothetical protein
MSSGVLGDLDFIEELRLRRWARENHVPRELRQTSWHSVIHEEMANKDNEIKDEEIRPAYAVAVG